MRFLLIQPPNNFLEQAYGLKRKIRLGHAPPLGIGYIAALLESGGHEVKILDALALDFSISQTVDEVKRFSPEIVGLSVLTNYADQAAELATEIRRERQDVIILLGGPHATYFFDEILDKMPAVDHVLYGEVENVILSYANLVKAQDDEFRRIKGLVYRDSNGKTSVNLPPEPPANLDEIPMPAWHLYNMSLYRPLPFQHRQSPFFTMITSRGCAWGKCKFCFQAGSCRPPYRRHSPQRVLNEMETLRKKFGIKEIAFWDDSFVMSRKWIQEFSAGIQQRNLGISWVASGRANVMTEEMVRMIHEAGCWSLFIGVESGNQELLDSIEKGIKLDDVRKAFKTIHKIGIESRGAFMLGLPGETPEMGRKTIQFAKELDPTYAIFYATHPRKGTSLFDISLQQGAFLSDQFKGMSKVTYVPKGYKGPKELAQALKNAYRTFYIRPRVILRFLRKLRSASDFIEGFKAFLLFLGLSDAK